MKDFRNALQTLKQGLKVAKEINAKSKIKEIYENFSIIYSLKKEYQKALDYFKLSTQIKDEIYN